MDLSQLQVLFTILVSEALYNLVITVLLMSTSKLISRPKLAYKPLHSRHLTLRLCLNSSTDVHQLLGKPSRSLYQFLKAPNSLPLLGHHLSGMNGDVTLLLARPIKSLFNSNTFPQEHLFMLVSHI